MLLPPRPPSCFNGIDLPCAQFSLCEESRRLANERRRPTREQRTGSRGRPAGQRRRASHLCGHAYLRRSSRAGALRLPRRDASVRAGSGEAAGKAQTMPVATLALGAAALLCVVALVFAIPMLVRPKPPAHYIDMGNRRFDPAGLGGRLIARWESSATYQLTIDPLEPQQLDGFRAVAADPPHPLSVVIRLKDAAGLVACQKEILLPAAQTAAETGPAKGAAGRQDAWRRHRAICRRRGRQACRDRSRGAAFLPGGCVSPLRGLGLYLQLSHPCRPGRMAQARERPGTGSKPHSARGGEWRAVVTALARSHRGRRCDHRR